MLLGEQDWAEQLASLPCVSMRTVRLRLVSGPLCPQIGQSLGVTQRLSTPWREKGFLLPEPPSACPVWVQGWGEEPPSDSFGH